MLIEVIALQPPHHYEGVVTIHLKKLLAGEPGEVNSVCSGGFTQEKTYYCAKCCTSFHGRCSMLCFMHARAGAQGGRVKPPVAVGNQLNGLTRHSVVDLAINLHAADACVTVQVGPSVQT